MAILFSEYLKNNDIKNEELSDVEKRHLYIYAWIEQLISVIAKSSVYYPEAYKHLGNFFLSYIEEYYIKKSWNNVQKKLSMLDQAANFFYAKIIDFAIRRSKEKPISPALEYSYNPAYSGVSICAYIVQEEGGLSHIYENMFWGASDYLNHEKAKSNIKDIRNNIFNALSTPSQSEPLKPLSEEAKGLIRRRVAGHFHAEDYWFSVQLIQLINFLEINREKWHMSKSENEEIWIQKLKAETRIEFVMTSSPCKDCQCLFVEAQNILTKLNLDIPIVIFSNSPTNTSEIEHSQIAVINTNNTYFNTGLVALMPYTLDRKKLYSQFLIAQEVYFGNKGMFNRLELSISQVMLEMILSPSSLRNSFIDSLFTNFDDGYVDLKSLIWFLDFLKRLPEGFYTIREYSRVITYSVPETEREAWLNAAPNRSMFLDKCSETIPATQTRVDSFLARYSQCPSLFFDNTNLYDPKIECPHKNLIFASLDETLEPYVLFSKDEDAISSELFEREDIRNYSISFAAVNRLRFFHAIKSDRYEERPSNTRPHNFDSYYYYSWRLKNGL